MHLIRVVKNIGKYSKNNLLQYFINILRTIYFKRIIWVFIFFFEFLIIKMKINNCQVEQLDNRERREGWPLCWTIGTHSILFPWAFAVCPWCAQHTVSGDRVANIFLISNSIILIRNIWIQNMSKSIITYKNISYDVFKYNLNHCVFLFSSFFIIFTIC